MKKEKPAVLLEHHLKRLKLPTFLREHEKMAIICREEEADYRTYLLRLAELETIDRERRAAERRIRAAKSNHVRASAPASRRAPRDAWQGAHTPRGGLLTFSERRARRGSLPPHPKASARV